MVSAIMHRISGLHKHAAAGGSGPPHEEDDRGVRIIMLTGNNTGAALHTKMDHERPGHSRSHGPVEYGEEDDGGPMSTFVNSNFQAINNSITMGGSHEVSDPGVHMEISDFVEHKKLGQSKHGKRKGERKEKENAGMSDQLSD